MQKHNTALIIDFNCFSSYTLYERKLFMANEEIPRGQLSNIILSTLFDNDKYGYEIIEVVKENTDGKVIIKQPTLYSSLRRMEEQGLISSYWRDSEIGGRRHYYSITDYGKKYADKWQQDLNDFLLSLKNMPANTNKQSTILQQANLVDMTKSKIDTKEVQENKPENKTFVQYDLFTSPTLISEPSNELFDRVKKLRDEADDEYKNQSTSDKIEMLSSLRNSSPTQEDITTNYVAKNYELKNQNLDMRKTFFDLTKNNKSFATAVRDNEVKNITDSNLSNGIDKITDTKENEDKTSENEIKPVLQQSNVDKVKDDTYNDTIYQSTKFDDESVSFVDLNQSINEPQISQLATQEVTNNQAQQMPSNLEQVKDVAFVQENKKIEETKPKDDAVYITAKPAENEIPKVRRITSERFEKITQNYTSFLDEKIRKEQQQKLDEMKNEDVDNVTETEDVEHESDILENYSEPEIFQPQQIKNLNDLANYYQKVNLKFNTYTDNKKSNMKKYTKINWLNLVSFSTITVLSIILSVVMYCLIGNSQPNWNFLYLLIPFIFIAIDALFIYKYVKHPNTITLTSNVLGFNWLYQIVLSIVTILVLCSINVLAGLSVDNLYNYLTTLLYTSLVVVLYPLLSLINLIVIKYKNR